MRRRRSRDVVAEGFPASVGEQVTDQVDAPELIANPLLCLLTGEKQDASRCLNEDQGAAVHESGMLT
jgi:hypothetical protein